MANIPAILSGVSGLAGLFGRKTSPYERESAAALRQQQDVVAELLRMARGYNPEQDDARALQYGQDAAAKAYKNSVASLLQKYGTNPGDTNFALDLQRTSDDVLSPLASQAAGLASTRFQRKMQAYQAALGTASPGELAGQYMQLGRNSAAMRPDTTGAQMLLGQAVDQLWPQSKRTPLDNATRAPGEIDRNSKLPYKSLKMKGTTTYF